MNIAIIGCGYIGSKAAALWVKQDHHVTGTTRSPENLEGLSKIVAKGLIFRGTDEEDLRGLIANNEILLVTIAADSAEHYESTYLDMAKLFRSLALEMNAPRQLIYTSSSSVYGDHHGLWVDETNEIKPSLQTGKILVDTETTYLSLEEIGWNVCILRLAEIYGPGRALSQKLKKLEGRSMPGSGNQYTNMIHADDCAAAIHFASQHSLEGVFNLADDDHPTRKEFYEGLAKRFHLKPIQWDPNLPSFHGDNKRVSNHKIKSKGFSLIHPHRTFN